MILIFLAMFVGVVDAKPPNVCKKNEHTTANVDFVFTRLSETDKSQTEVAIKLAQPANVNSMGAFLRRCPRGSELEAKDLVAACTETRFPFDGVSDHDGCVYKTKEGTFLSGKSHPNSGAQQKLPGETQVTNGLLNFIFKEVKDEILGKNKDWFSWMEERHARRDVRVIQLAEDGYKREQVLYHIKLSRRTQEKGKVVSDFIEKGGCIDCTGKERTLIWMNCNEAKNPKVNWHYQFLTDFFDGSVCKGQTESGLVEELANGTTSAAAREKVVARRVQNTR